MKKLFLIALVVIALVGVAFIGSDDKPRKKEPPVPREHAVNPAQAPTDLGEWELLRYRTLEGVPEGYYGPFDEECKRTQDPRVCLNGLKEVLKHDPEILADKLRDFHLLDDFLGMPEKEFEQLSDQEVEKLRKEASIKLEDEKLRREWQPKAAAIIDGMYDLEYVPLEGEYNSEYVDDDGNVFQIRKRMNPEHNFAVRGKLPGTGEEYLTKVDCNHQRVSKQTLPDVPPPPGPPQFPPPSVPTTTPTTVPEQGKDDQTSSHDEDSDVPDQIRGCAGTGSVPAGAPSDGNDCPGNTGGTADPQCTNTDGTHTYEADGYCDNNRPAPSPSSSTSSSSTSTSTSTTTTSTTAPPSDREGPSETTPTTVDQERESATTTTQPGHTGPTPTTTPPTYTPPPPD